MHCLRYASVRRQENLGLPLRRVSPVLIEGPCCWLPPREPEAFEASGIHRVSGLGRQMLNCGRLIGSAKIGITVLDFFLIHFSEGIEQARLESGETEPHFVLARESTWKRKSLIIPSPCLSLKLGATGIRNTQELSSFVQGFTRRVIDGSSQNLYVSALRSC